MEAPDYDLVAGVEPGLVDLSVMARHGAVGEEHPGVRVAACLHDTILEAPMEAPPRPGGDDEGEAGEAGNPGGRLSLTEMAHLDDRVDRLGRVRFSLGGGA